MNGMPMYDVVMYASYLPGKKLMSNASSYGMRTLKKCHDAPVYTMVHTGLHNNTWVPMDHQNQPKYDGWRRYLANRRTARVCNKSAAKVQQECSKSAARVQQECSKSAARVKQELRTCTRHS
jgi:hypothetical protein